ncbi:MAG TPA: DUF948 domain-containing protein [Actinomycetes bacterium]|nr:DUF948 domain-containing protein [Actinomycetes bacterium]
MSALDWAWFAVAILVIGLVVTAIVVLSNLFRVLTSVKDLVDGVTRQTVPLLGEVGTTVSMVNTELGRVDGILASAEGITATTGNLVDVISNTITSPLVRLSAFLWGLRRAVGAAGEGDQGGGRRSRFGRRR